MQSAIFGPPFWMTIHLISFNYPVEPTEAQKKDYSDWLRLSGKVLPCRYCRENVAANVEAAGFDWGCMASRDTFARFCYKLHDNVNRMLNKSSPPFEEIRSKYESFRARCLTAREAGQLHAEEKELGCLRPTHDGEKGKCHISIVPHSSSEPSFKIDDKCQPQGPQGRSVT
jgi:hypothetical protein